MLDIQIRHVIISLQTFKVSILKPVGEAVKIERKKNVINVTLLYGGWGAEVIVTLLILCLEWPNSSRNAKKIFSPLWGGGPQSPSEDQFWENFLSILTFSRGKNDFDQSCSLWCQKLKKNRLWIVTLVGGEGVKTKSVTFVTLFFFYFDGFPQQSKLSTHLSTERVGVRGVGFI